MIEDLSDKNQKLQSQVQQLSITVNDLETSQELMEELDSSQREEITRFRKLLDKYEVNLTEKDVEISTLTQTIAEHAALMDNYKSRMEALKHEMIEREQQWRSEANDYQLQLQRLRESSSISYSMEEMLSEIFTLRLEHGRMRVRQGQSIFKQLLYDHLYSSHNPSNQLAEVQKISQRYLLGAELINNLSLILELILRSNQSLSIEEYLLLGRYSELLSSCMMIATYLSSEHSNSAVQVMMIKYLSKINKSINDLLVQFQGIDVMKSLSGIRFDEELEEGRSLVTSLLEDRKVEKVVLEHMLSIRISSIVAFMKLSIERVAVDKLMMIEKYVLLIDSVSQSYINEENSSSQILCYASVDQAMELLAIFENIQSSCRDYLRNQKAINLTEIETAIQAYNMLSSSYRDDTSSLVISIDRSYAMMMMSKLQVYQDSSFYYHRYHQLLLQACHPIQQLLQAQESALANLQLAQARLNLVEENLKQKSMELQLSLKRCQELDLIFQQVPSLANRTAGEQQQQQQDERLVQEHQQLKLEVQSLRETVIQYESKLEKASAMRSKTTASHDSSAVSSVVGGAVHGEVLEVLRQSRKREYLWKNLAMRRMSIWLKELHLKTRNEGQVGASEVATTSLRESYQQQRFRKANFCVVELPLA
jgi:hypothetical protein